MSEPTNEQQDKWFSKRRYEGLHKRVFDVLLTDFRTYMPNVELDEEERAAASSLTDDILKELAPDLTFTSQKSPCSCDGDPIECGHEAALGQAKEDSKKILNIVSKWCVEYNNVSVDARILAQRLKEAGYPLPDPEESTDE